MNRITIRTDGDFDNLSPDARKYVAQKITDTTKDFEPQVSYEVVLEDFWKTITLQ